jgi:hypothetical protein
MDGPWVVYFQNCVRWPRPLYDACDQISDFYHQQLLRKMRRKMCIYKCMLNVYKNQQNRQTGSRNLMGGHKLHICTPYRGKRFWTHQIPTSCLPNLLIFIHIEHTFVYAHFSSHFSKQLLMTEFDITCNSNTTSFFRFVNKRAIYRLGIISLAHAPVHVTDFPVVNVHVDEYCKLF